MSKVRDERLRDAYTANFQKCFQDALRENAYPAYISGLYGRCGDNLEIVATQFSAAEFRYAPGVGHYLLRWSIRSYYVKYAVAPIVASLFFIARPTAMDELIESLNASRDGFLHWLEQPLEGCAVYWRWIGFEPHTVPEDEADRMVIIPRVDLEHLSRGAEEQ